MSTLKVDGIRSNSASSDAITLAGDGTCTANITNNLSNRNLIINGAAQINQRGNKTGVGQGNTYTLDRWEFFGQSTSAEYTITQSTDAPNGFGNSLKLDCTTVDSSLDANTENTLFTKLEGQDLQSIAKGTSAAKKLTLSFYVKTNKTGTYCVHLKDGDNNRDVSGSYTVSDTNWNRYTISFPADTTGAFDNDNNKSLDVKWFLCCGSNRNTGSLNTAWRSNVNSGSAPGQVNLADSTDNEWSITGVQLEVDHTGSGVASDFEHRSVGQELQLCKRYYQKWCEGNSKYVGNGLVSGATEVHAGISLPVSMRGTVAIDHTNGNDYWRIAGSMGGDKYIDGAWIIDNQQPNVFNIYATPDTNLSSYVGDAGYVQGKNASSYMAFESEL